MGPSADGVAPRIEPFAQQLAVLDDRHRFILAVAGAQGGKSRSVAEAVAERVRETFNRLLPIRSRQPLVLPDGRTLIANFWVVDPSFELAAMPQLYLSTRWPTAKWTGRMTQSGVYRRCEPWPGCQMSFKSGDDPDKLRSEPVDGAWLNEAAIMNPTVWRNNVRMRLNATGGWCYADSTPEGMNWLYEDFWIPSLPPGHPDHDPARYSPEHSAHAWHTADNPAISRGEIEHAQRTLPAAYFARQYLADWSAFHGQVYPHFGKDCVRPVSETEYPELVLGVDWGYAPGHLGVILVAGVDRKKRSVGILEETCAEGRTDDWWAGEFRRIKAKYPRVRTAYCDPSAPDKLSYFRQNVRGVAFTEANNAVRDGIMCVADVIGTGRFAVSTQCGVTVRQMTSYHWLDGTERSGGEWQERPAKVEDDAPDACRYLTFTSLNRAKISYL